MQTICVVQKNSQKGYRPSDHGSVCQAPSAKHRSMRNKTKWSIARALNVARVGHS